MYAIRSYYEPGRSLGEGVAQFLQFALVVFGTVQFGDGRRRVEFFAAGGYGRGKCQQIRITSYNVCYTKLLRIGLFYLGLAGVAVDLQHLVIVALAVCQSNTSFRLLP